MAGETRPTVRLATVNIDCADAEAMAEFYSRLLDWERTYRDEDFILMRDPDGGAGLSFQAREGYRPPVWPEKPEGQDKMIHVDIKVDDLDAAVAHALASGARLAEYRAAKTFASSSIPPAIPSACLRSELR